MRKHFYQKQKPCPTTKHNVELTEDVKQHILNFRIYHIPKVTKQKIINKTINNYNTMNNFINNMDVIEKLNRYMEHTQQELISFDDSVDDKLIRKVKELHKTTHHNEDVELDTDDFLKVIDQVTSVCHQIPKLNAMNMLYDAKMNRLKFFDNGDWNEQMLVSGIQYMFSLIQASYLHHYELYLICKIKKDTSFMVRQRCRELLEEYYKFIGTLQMDPAIKGQDDGDVFNISSTSTEVVDEFMTLYNKITSTISVRERNALKKEVVDILKNNSKRNVAELNKSVLELFRMDDVFKDKIHALLQGIST